MTGQEYLILFLVIFTISETIFIYLLSKWYTELHVSYVRMSKRYIEFMEQMSKLIKNHNNGET